MKSYASGEYTEAKKWISKKITDGFDWESVKTLCVAPESAESVFLSLRDEELIIPGNMEYSEWADFVDETRSGYSPLSDP